MFVITYIASVLIMLSGRIKIDNDKISFESFSHILHLLAICRLGKLWKYFAGACRSDNYLSKKNALIHIIIQQILMNSESFTNSWNHEPEKKEYISEQLTPQNVMLIIDTLKNQRISDIEACFSFKREPHLKKFLEMVKKEEESELQDTNKVRVHNKSRFSSPPENLEKLYKFELCTSSPILAEIFMKAYEDKIKKLEIEHTVKIYKGVQSIIIADQNKNKNNILSSQMMAMHKRLKVYIIYRNQQIWKIVDSSLKLQKQFFQAGISCYFHIPRSRTLAFYSTLLTEEDIKKTVNKKLGYTLKIFDFYDKQLRQEKNVALFGLLSRAIEKKINQIREIYETDLEINEKACCFVFHIKHEVFASSPISQLQSFISDLTFVSFPLRNSRNYLNQIKRLAKNHPYLEVTQSNHRIFCCINHRKIKKKDEIMFIFKRFLENISDHSKLTVHLKYHNTLLKDCNLPEKVLDLIEENKLTCEDFEDIFNKKKHNIDVSIKNPMGLNSHNRALKQAQFANFLTKLLDFQSSIGAFTQQDMNQTFQSQQKPLLSVQISNTTQSIVGAYTGQAEEILPQNVLQKANDKLIGTKIEPENFIEAIFHHEDKIAKKERVKEIQEIIYSQETIRYRCWRIAVPEQIFKYEGELDEKQLFLVKNIYGPDEQKQKNPELAPFTLLQNNSQGYLVYFNEDMSEYLPVALVKRMG